MSDTPKLPVISSQASPVEVRRAFAILREWFAKMQKEGGVPSVSALERGAIAVKSTTDGSYQTPTAPSGFTATGGFATIFLEWDNPTYTGHSYTEIWRASEDVLGSAVLVGMAPGTLYADVPAESSLAKTYYYWVRHVNIGGYAGPYNATAGTPASTADDPTYLLELLMDELGYENFQPGQFPVRVVSSLPVLPSTEWPVGSLAYLTTDGKLYRNVDNVWTAAVAAVDITGQLTDAQLAGIAAAKIAGQLTDAQIAAISAAKVTGQIVSTQISDDAITTPKLAAGAVTAAEIAAHTITAGQIAALAITAAEISAGAISAAKIATGAVTAEKIAALAVTAGKIAAGAVTANEIAANAITADKITTNAITTGKIEAGAVIADKIAAGAVIAEKLAAASVTAEKLAAMSITADKISTASLSALSANMGTLTSGVIELLSGLAKLRLEAPRIQGFDTSGVSMFDLNCASNYFRMGRSGEKEIVWNNGTLTLPSAVVETLHIGINQVTIPYLGNWGQTSSLPANTWITFFTSPPLDFFAQPSIFMFLLPGMSVTSTNPSGTAIFTFTVELLFDGTTIFTNNRSKSLYHDSTNPFPTAFVLEDDVRDVITPPNGSGVYSMRGRVTSSAAASNSFSIGSGSFLTLGCRR